MLKRIITKAHRSSYYFGTSVNHQHQSLLKTKMIQTSLKYIPKYGWTDNAIIAACQQLNISAASHRVISTYSIIDYLMTKWNQQSLRDINDTNFGENKRIRHKIHYSIKTRLTKEIPFIDTWHQAMAIGAHPNNISRTKDLLWDYSDQIWFLCGDRSADSNYYTKRILFNSAYAATQLHLLTDKSQNKFATWEFLQRRLDDVQSIGTVARNAKLVFGSLGNGILSVIGAIGSPGQVKNPIRKQQSQKVQSQSTNFDKQAQKSAQKQQIKHNIQNK